MAQQEERDAGITTVWYYTRPQKYGAAGIYSEYTYFFV